MDGRCPMLHSWLMTDDGAWAIGDGSWPALYAFLLKPQLRFSLSLVDAREANHLQCAIVNDLCVIEAGTELLFTINNVKFKYTVYELDQAIRYGEEGKSSGVQELFKIHRPSMKILEPEGPVKRGRGRPPKIDEEDGRVLAKMIRRSGYDQCTG